MLLLQHVRQALARAAVAAHDDVALGRETLRGYSVQRERLQHPFGARPAQSELVACLNDERRDKHGEQHRRDDQLGKVAIEQCDRLREDHEHQAELAHLGEGQPRAYGSTGAGSEQTREARHQDELEYDEQRSERQRQR